MSIKLLTRTIKKNFHFAITKIFEFLFSNHSRSFDKMSIATKNYNFIFGHFAKKYDDVIVNNDKFDNNNTILDTQPITAIAVIITVIII